MEKKEKPSKVYRPSGITNPYHGLIDFDKMECEYEWFESDGSVTYLSEEDHRKRERAEAEQE